MLSIFPNGQEEISRFGKMATMINFFFCSNNTANIIDNYPKKENDESKAYRIE